MRIFKKSYHDPEIWKTLSFRQKIDVLWIQFLVEIGYAKFDDDIVADITVD